MSRILITGGLGFVGGRLSRRLSVEHEVLVSSRNRTASEMLKLNRNIKFVNHQDLLSPADFPVSVDMVIHLAGLNESDSVKYPSEAIRVNVDETRTILENSIAAHAGKFIYFSTAHIYGSPLSGYITEAKIPVPVHPYAVTHRAAEDYIVAAVRQKRIRGLIFRLSNSFGAPVNPKMNRWKLLANDLCRQAVETGKLTLQTNGCQFRDFVCLTDVEEIIATLPGKNNHHIIYNLGSGKSMRVIDMAEKIARLATEKLGKKITVELPANAQPSVEAGLHYSIDRLLSDGFRILNPVDMEIENLLQFCKINFAGGN